MKPLVLEYVFDCYSKGKQRSTYDAIDGVSWTPRQREMGALAGDTPFALNTMLDEVVAEMHVVPREPYHAPLEPEVAERARILGRQLSDMSDEFANRRLSVPDGITAVQFENPSKFVKSTDHNVEITVGRSGDSTSEQTVTFKTRDNTAKAGRHYVRAEGNVTFKPGETQKVILVQLLSGHGDNNINFKVDLLDSRFVNIGPVKTQNVNITDYNDLSRSEQSTIRHIIEARIPSVPHIINTLSENVTIETFKTALLCLCSNADSYPREIRVAFDLLKFALPYCRREHLMPFVTQYFENAPDLEEMDISEEKSDSDMSQDSDISNSNSRTSEENSDLD